MHSVQRLYVQDIRELNSVSGRRVSELTWCRAEQMNEKSVRFYLPLWLLILYIQQKKYAPNLNMIYSRLTVSAVARNLVNRN